MGIIPNLSEDKEAYDHVFNDIPLGMRKRIDGGPHGLGIPEDRTLLPAEKTTVIPAVMREIILREFCINENRDYSSCKTQNRYTSYFKCGNCKHNLNSCITKFRNIKGLEEAAIEEYLEERFQYRLTGLSKSYRENKNLAPPGRKLFIGVNVDIPSFEELNSPDRKKHLSIWDTFVSSFSEKFGFKKV